ncbi:hypothetical protein PN480_07145 [Dolichospermum circinale CS-1225]|uniref:hypothetical protein n=1 Tax=Dolichospermum circinale TaxID=109265 RepID=UPI0004126F4B|nr:hypothetical protein [Dolichospermum circinale]MDB9458227.1 hypothetical protein [Dolichospermum circinale CS-545/17]MDB9521728.1 hypothetical protein [Dolichospermum circinale CS-1225]
MDLSLLKWTKNVKREDGDWAYSRYKVYDLFKLAWKDSEQNAGKPEKDDLILLRQHGYVTHLVRVLDYKPEHEDWKGDYNIYRIVEVSWAIDFVTPPKSAKADKIFDYSEVLSYQGGNIMKLEELPTFKDRWDKDGGLEAFQTHIQSLLEL